MHRKRMDYEWQCRQLYRPNMSGKWPSVWFSMGSNFTYVMDSRWAPHFLLLAVPSITCVPSPPCLLSLFPDLTPALPLALHVASSLASFTSQLKYQLLRVVFSDQPIARAFLPYFICVIIPFIDITYHNLQLFFVGCLPYYPLAPRSMHAGTVLVLTTALSVVWAIGELLCLQGDL